MTVPRDFNFLYSVRKKSLQPFHLFLSIDFLSPYYWLAEIHCIRFAVSAFISIDIVSNIPSTIATPRVMQNVHRLVYFFVIHCSFSPWASKINFLKVLNWYWRISHWFYIEVFFSDIVYGGNILICFNPYIWPLLNLLTILFSAWKCNSLPMFDRYLRIFFTDSNSWFGFFISTE